MAARRARRALSRAGNDAAPGRGLAARVGLDGAVLDRALSRRDRGRATFGKLGLGPPLDTQAPAQADEQGAARARLRSALAHRLGSAADRVRSPATALDGLALPRTPWPLPAAEAGQGGGAPFRVAVSRRPVPDGHQALRALLLTWPRGHR